MRLVLAVLVIACVTLSLSPSPALGMEPVVCNGTLVDLDTGSARGIIANNSRIWWGLPFAQPPVGDLRWQSPQPPQSWSGIRNATVNHGVECIQRCELQAFGCGTTMSEDCLLLNVFAPLAPVGSYPVLVFFHGGNFFQGAGDAVLYEASALAARDMVVVTVNYRLGAMGFMYSNRTDSVEGNYGIEDQRAALEWVQRNAKAFGGDPARVTISGQSAGAESVAIHLMQPRTNPPLFVGAILESEPFGLPLRNRPQWTVVADAMAKSMGCANDNATCWRAQPWQAVLDAQNKIFTDISVDLPQLLSAFEPFTPVVGTDLVPVQPVAAFQAGKVQQETPVLLGNTAQEATVFVYEAMAKPVSALVYGLALDFIFGFGNGKLIAEKYPLPAGTTDARQMMSTVATDALFLCANRNVSRHLAARTSGAPVYYYMFDHYPTEPGAGKQAWGNITACYNASCHGSELPFVFRALELFDHTQGEADLADRMETYWANFVKTGNPNTNTTKASNSGTLTNWPAYDAEQSQDLRFMVPDDKVETFFRKDICDFWDSLGYLWEQQ